MKVTPQNQSTLPQASNLFYKIPGAQTVRSIAIYFFNVAASVINCFLTCLNLRSTTDLTKLPIKLQLNSNTDTTSETREEKIARRAKRVATNLETRAEANREFTPSLLKSITQYVSTILFSPSPPFSENRTTALERVNKAQEEEATSLDLSGLKLTGEDVKFLIPKIRNQLPNLTKLDLSFNPLALFSPGELQELGELTSLTHLNLQATRSFTVPKAVYQLKNLTTLHIGGNPLRSIPERLAELPNLAELKIKRKRQPSGLRRLPYTEQQIPQALRNKPGLQINQGLTPEKTEPASSRTSNFINYFLGK